MKYRRRLRILLLLLGSIILTLCGYIFFLRNDRFFLKQIIVNGDERLITHSLATFRRQHIFFLNTESIEWEFHKQPWVERVQLRKRLPDTLVVTLTKRIPVAYTSTSGEKFYFDKTGKVLPQLKTLESDRLPLLSCGDVPHVGDVWKINGSVRIFELLGEISTVNIPVEDVNCVSDTVFDIEIDGVLYKISALNEVERTVGSLLFLFKQFRIEGKRPKTVDLRFEKPVLRMDDGFIASPASNSGI